MNVLLYVDCLLVPLLLLRIVRLFDNILECIEECPYLNGSLKSGNMDMLLFKRNIQFIAEVLAHYMFDLKDSSLVRRFDYD